jgi:hypothetical protein
MNLENYRPTLRMVGVIGTTKVQNEAGMGRNEYRKLLGGDLIREIILK